MHEFFFMLHVIAKEHKISSKYILIEISQIISSLHPSISKLNIL